VVGLIAVIVVPADSCSSFGGRKCAKLSSVVHTVLLPFNIAHILSFVKNVNFGGQ